MATELLTADAPGIGGAPQWGIFKDNKPVLVSDSVGSVEYTRDYQISDYPQEKGAFASYNKVQVPYQTKLSFLIGATRKDFLSALDAAVKSLDLVTVVTPEIFYDSANLMHCNYRREAQHGVTLIRVDVWCEEVRIVAGPEFSDSKSTNGAGADVSGQTQPVPTVQNEPKATELSVGGAFTTEFDRFKAETNTTIIPFGKSALAGDITTLPPAIPRTSGSAGSLDPPKGITVRFGKDLL